MPGLEMHMGPSPPKVNSLAGFSQSPPLWAAAGRPWVNVGCPAPVCHGAPWHPPGLKEWSVLSWRPQMVLGTLVACPACLVWFFKPTHCPVASCVLAAYS